MALFQRNQPAPSPPPPSIGTTTGEDLFAAGRFAGAREAMRRAHASHHASLDAVRRFRLLAQAEREMAAYDAALAACDRGLAMLDRLPPSTTAQSERSLLLGARGQTLIEAGRHGEAEGPLQEAMKLATPDRTIEGALALRSLGEVRSAQARFAEAEEIYARAEKALFALLPPIHRERGHVVNSCGLAALSLGKLAEAEERLRRGLLLRQEMLLSGHADLGESLHNIATVALRRGRLDDAEALERQVMAIWEAALGSGHPRIALTLGNLGAIAQKRGNFAEADRFYRRGLAIREASLGPDHPRLIVSLNNIGAVQNKLGHPAEAEALFRRGLELARCTRGENHPEVARALNNLQGVLEAQGKSREAEESLRRAITIWESTLGPENAELATSLTNLAGYQSRRGEVEEAEATLLRVLAINSKRLGAEHPDLATPLNNLANLYVGAGRLNQAEAMYFRAQELRGRAGYRLGPETFFNLAEIAARQGRYSDQCDYLLRATDILEQTVGENAARLPFLYRALGHGRRELDDLPGAIDALQRALAIGERTDTQPDDLALTLAFLGSALTAGGKAGEAEATFRRGVGLLERAGNPEPLRLVDLLVLLGVLLVRTHRSREALPVLDRARMLAESALGQDHALLHAALLWLGYASLALGDVESAERYLVGSFGQGDLEAAVSANRASLALYGLRRVYRSAERPDELAAVLENLVEVRTAQGASDRQIAVLLRELGDSHFAAGRYITASRLFERVQRADDGTCCAAFRGSTAFFHALCLSQLGADAGAHAQFALAADTYEHAQPSDPASHALTLSIWIGFLAARQRVDDIVELLPQLSRLADTAGFRPETVGAAYESLGMGYGLQRRWDEAEAAFRRALVAWEDPVAAESVGMNAIVVRHQLARLEQARGRSAEAEAAYRDTVARYEAAGPAAGGPLAAVLGDLATLLEQTGRAAEVADLRRRANDLTA